MSTVTLVVSPDGKTITPAAGSHIVEPKGTADPNELALASLMVDSAFGIGGLEERYRLLPVIHDGKVVLIFGEWTSCGVSPIAELWPPRERYATIPTGESESSEQLLESPSLPPLDVAIFPRYRDGGTSDLIGQVNPATPAGLPLAIAAAVKRVGEGIYDLGCSDQAPDSRAIGVDVTLILAG